MIDPAKHTFDTLWGHEAQKAFVLGQLSSGRLPQVLLLEGPHGVGKRSFALAAAKVILSASRRLGASEAVAPTLPKAKRRNPDTEPSDDLFAMRGDSASDLFASESDEPDLFASAPPAAPEPPPEPPHVLSPPASRREEPLPRPRFAGLHPDVCRRVEASYPVSYDSDGMQENMAHPDLCIVEPSGNSKSILAGQIDALHRMVGLPPIQGDCRLVLIFGIDTITAFAANSMLKLLEEPPSALRFILVTDNPGRTLATIRSRSSRLTFFPMKRAEIESALIGREGLARDVAAVAAALSQGRPGVALRIAAGGVLQKRRELFEARLSLERLGLPGLPGASARVLAAGGTYEESLLFLMTFLRDRVVFRHAPGRSEFLVNSDVPDLLGAGTASDGQLDEEWDALLLALAEARHPFLPNQQAAMECALWQSACGPE